MSELWRLLPSYLGGHVQISAASLALGIAISLPLSVLVARVAALRGPVLAAVGVVQTIPSLALLALFYPLMLLVKQLLAGVGVDISALGFLPSLLALTLYSMLPIVRNTVTGITGVDRAVTEAARGMGMTERQVLWRVELPLATPVIVAGIRTATVWVIGIATLATPIGQVCLGNYIFSGLGTDQPDWVLFGCVAAAIIALTADGLVGQIEIGFRRAQRWRLRSAAAAMIVLIAIGAALPALASLGRAAPTGPTVVIGSKDFTEQYILSNLIQQRLAGEGYNAKLIENLGSGIVFDALANGEVDCYIDYTGTIWANYMQREQIIPREPMLQEVADWLNKTHGITVVGALGFENTYAIAMPEARADATQISTIDALSRKLRPLRIAGTSEFFARPEWQALRDTYDLQHAEPVAMSPTLMYGAAVAGDVDAISGFSTDGRLSAFKLRVLADPRQVFPPYDAVVLVGPKLAGDERAMAALRQLVGRIDMSLMQRANDRVDREDQPQTPAEAAEWLGETLRQAE